MSSQRGYVLAWFRSEKEDRVFLVDKAYNVVSYKLLLSVLNYQTAVVRRDFDSANAMHFPLFRRVSTTLWHDSLSLRVLRRKL